MVEGWAVACPVVENQPHNGQVALFPGPAHISVARAQGEPGNKANGQVGGKKVASVFACSINAPWSIVYHRYTYYM